MLVDLKASIIGSVNMEHLVVLFLSICYNDVDAWMWGQKQEATDSWLGFF